MVNGELENIWCKCRIVKPRLFQHGDTLRCLNCQLTKELPPVVDLGWEADKRSFRAMGKEYYADCHKDALIEMLVNRDIQLLDEYEKSRTSNNPFNFSDSQVIRKKIENNIEYVCFKD